MIMDGTFIKSMPPTAIMGDVVINSAVMVPRKMTTIGENMKMEALGVQSDLNSGFATLQKLESSVSESSNDVQQAGITDPNSKTAFQVSVEEKNAAIVGGLVRRMISFFVRDWMTLRMGDIFKFMTVGEIDGIVGDDATLKSRSFLVPDSSKDGQVNNNIRFRTNAQYTPEQVVAMEGGAPEESVGNLDQVTLDQYMNKGYKSKERISIVNPELFRNLKYKIVQTQNIEQPNSHPDSFDTLQYLFEQERKACYPKAPGIDLHEEQALSYPPEKQ